MKLHIYTLVVSLFLTLPLSATERYALKEGLNCNACHYNPSGGGPLNIKGRYYERHDFSLEGFSEYLSSLKKILEERKRKQEITGILTTALERLSVQGNIRTLFKHTLDRQPTVFQENFDLLDAQMALGMKVHDRLDIVYTTELNDLHTGDVFITGAGPAGTFLQIGRYTTPFGLNSDDPIMMVRSIYGLQYFLKDIGITIGYEQPTGLFLNASALNGFRQFSPTFGGISSIGDPFRGLAFSGNMGYHLKNFLFGFSGLLETSGEKADSHADTEGLAALFISSSLGRFHLSAEADFGFKKGIGTGNRAGLPPDASPKPVKTAAADLVEPFYGKISPDFGDRSLGSFVKLTYDLIPNQWDISAQYETLSGNIQYLGDAPIRVTVASKYWMWKNFFIEPQFKYNRTPSGIAKNAPNRQLEEARRKNKHEIRIYARAAF